MSAAGVARREGVGVHAGPRRVVHLELHTGDQMRASAFYERLLHWQPESIRASCGSYLAFEAGGVGIAAEDLQGNPPAELEILRGPNLGHPTDPEAVVESVATPYQFIRHGASLCGLRG